MTSSKRAMNIDSNRTVPYQNPTERLSEEEARLYQEATQKAVESIEEIDKLQNKHIERGGYSVGWLSGNDLRKLNEATDELRQAITMFSFVRESRIQLSAKIERGAGVER